MLCISVYHLHLVHFYSLHFSLRFSIIIHLFSFKSLSIFITAVLKVFFSNCIISVISVSVLLADFFHLIMDYKFLLFHISNDIFIVLQVGFAWNLTLRWRLSRRKFIVECLRMSACRKEGHKVRIDRGRNWAAV